MTPAGYPRHSITGVILAGGLSRRMQGLHKASAVLGGQTLLDRTIKRMEPQCAAIIVSANNPELPIPGDLPAVRDAGSDQAGPAAGILAAMDWVEQHSPQTRWLLSAPVDSPFLPLNFACRLWEAANGQNASLALARSGNYVHHTCGLWRITLRENLHDILNSGIRRVQTVTGKCDGIQVEWDTEPRDPFFNINTRSDLDAASALLARSAPE